MILKDWLPDQFSNFYVIRFRLKICLVLVLRPFHT